MVSNNVLLFRDCGSSTQIFKSICIMSLLCIIYCKPLQRNVSEEISDLKPHHVSLEDVERLKIIAELRTKILKRLKLDYTSTTNDRHFNWDTVPEEMKDVFNQELDIENDETDINGRRLETIILPLLKSNKCHSNQSINTECFHLSIPHFDYEGLKSAKFLAPLRSDIEIELNNSLKYNITINRHKIEYDLLTDNSDSGNVEIDILNALEEVMSNHFDNMNATTNETRLFTRFHSYENNYRISQIIDVTKLTMEIRYRSPVLKRTKRDTNACVPNQYFCCKQSLRVNFQELDLMKYIAAPRSFIFNYCKGDCNNYVHYSSNNAKAHSFIRNQGQTEQRETRPCCVPHTFSSQKIMYYSKNNTLLKAVINDLSAVSCGCL